MQSRLWLWLVFRTYERPEGAAEVTKEGEVESEVERVERSYAGEFESDVESGVES